MTKESEGELINCVRALLGLSPAIDVTAANGKLEFSIDEVSCEFEYDKSEPRLWCKIELTNLEQQVADALPKDLIKRFFRENTAVNIYLDSGTFVFHDFSKSMIRTCVQSAWAFRESLAVLTREIIADMAKDKLKGALIAKIIERGKLPGFGADKDKK